MFINKFNRKFWLPLGIVKLLILLTPLGLWGRQACPCPTIDRDISSDTTWDCTCTPYILARDIIVLPGATLKIKPDVKVDGQTTNFLEVRGRLEAEGTKTEPILLGVGTWSGLRFAGGTGYLKYVTMRHAGAAGLFIGRPEVVGLAIQNIPDNGEVLIENSRIEDAKAYPLAIDTSDLHQTRLLNSAFSNNNPNRIVLEGSILPTNITLSPQAGLEGYALSHTLSVPPNVTLTLHPGVTIYGGALQELRVHGHLDAIGTSANPVVLGGDNWRGLLFSGGTGHLNHVVIRRAGAAYLLPGFAHIVGLAIQDIPANGEILIENSHFEDSKGYPLSVRTGELHQLRLLNNTFHNNQPNRAILAGSTITTNITLAPQSGLEGYELSHTLAVQPNITLTLQSGVAIYGDTLHEFRVHGHLEAVGTAGNPILFTSKGDSSSSPWNGLWFIDGTGHLKYVTVRYGGNNITPLLIKTNVYVRNAAGNQAMRMEDSQIENSNGNGLYVDHGRVILDHVTIQGNKNEGILVSKLSDDFETDLRIHCSTIMNNGGTGLDNQGSLNVDARATWWGDPSGPGGSAPGAGDEVSNRVLFDPWLQAPPNVSCPSLVDKEPLIFIPGISGSSLREKGSTSNLWMGNRFLTDYKKLSLRKGEEQEIEAIDAIRTYGIFQFKKIYAPMIDKFTANGGYQEYHLSNDPQWRLPANCAQAAQSGEKPTLFIFPYDWRVSNQRSAQVLADYVACVQKFHPNSQVNIVAHSMGGLIARRYILDHPNEHYVKRLITIGTPWLGAPKAIHTLETGEMGFLFNLLVISRHRMKELVEFFPGVHELLPSQKYFDLGGRPFREQGWDVNQDGLLSTYDYAALKNFLDVHHSATQPMSKNELFHSIPGMDNWQGDQSGVEYHVIYGVGRRNNTITQVVARDLLVCTPIVWVCAKYQFFDVKRTRGDGTVPQVSSERRGAGFDLNGPATLYTITGGKTEHLALTQNESVQNLVLELLNPSPARNGEPAEEQVRPPNEVEPAYSYLVHGADAVLVTDEAGNSTATVEDELIQGDVPDVTVHTLGEKDFLIILPTDRTFTVTFSASTEPLVLEATKELGDMITEVRRYQDLLLPDGVSTAIRFSSQAIQILAYDSNGDGTFDTTVQPTAVASGPDAQDVEPPTLSVNIIKNETLAQVNIAALDNGTGVDTIYYSLDGVHFQLYKEPILVDVNQVTLIYAFADDKLANRSSLLTRFLVDYPSYLPLIMK